MLTPLLVVCIAVVLLLTVAGTLFARRRRRASVSMEQTWQAWLSDDALDAGARETRQALLAQMDSPVQESVHHSLLEFENRLRDDAAPLQSLRRELMDSVDRHLLNQEILQLPPEVRTRLREHSPDMLQTDEQARVYILANELRLQLLREYGARRFADRADGDWFDVYEKASRLKQRGARNFIQRTLSGTQSSSDDARYQSMALVDHEIRARLLKVPAGTRFPGFGAVTEPKG